MTTWQSSRLEIGRPQPTAEQLAAKRQRADERRLSLPPPLYPAERTEGQWRGHITIELDGCLTRVELLQAGGRRRRRPRSDSFEARVDGRLVASGGLHAIVRRMLGAEVPRPLSRSRLASLAAR